MIRQGDLYWVDLGEPSGSEPGYVRPCVVIQNNLTNRTPIRTVIVCSLTANVARGAAPGNVVLDKGEGGLPERSVVNVSQVATVNKNDLLEEIGTLSSGRVQEILDGLRELTEPRDL